MIAGAGIFVVESYQNTPVVPLFGMHGTEYSEPGGRIDPGEMPQDAAYREGREETANLINIGPNELLQYAAPVTVHQYMAYVIYIEGISYSDYMYNVNLINNGCHQRVWKETNSMVRIPLNNIIVAAQNNINYAADIYGASVFIRGRTLAIVRAAANILWNIANSRPIPLYKHLVTSSHLPCLIGTYTYTMAQQAIYNPPVVASNIEYAVYVAPNITSTGNPLSKCNSQWGGLHVTIAGFHYNQPMPQQFLKHVSGLGGKPWTMNVKTIKIKKDAVYFKSKTLDTVANFLRQNNFYKVKGKWHITFECDMLKNIKGILGKQTWSLVVVSRSNGVVKWSDMYPLNVL